MAYLRERALAGGRQAWDVRWREKGERKLHTRSFAMKDDAQRWLTLLEAAGSAAALRVLGTPDAVTTPALAEILRRHITGLSGIQEGTRRAYTRMAEGVLIPALGDMPVPALARDDIARWVNAQEREGMSPKTIANRHSLLSSALMGAHRDGIVVRNVAEGVRLPRTVRRDILVLTQGEFAELLDLIPERWRPLVLLLGATGMRWSEATALQVQDVDLAGRQIRITRAWKETRGEGHRVGPPKSDRGTRTLPLPSACRTDLDQLIRGRDPGAWLFTNRNGGPVRHSGFYTKVWVPTVHAFAGDTPRSSMQVVGGVRRTVVTWDEGGRGKRPRIHDLRHSYASWAIAAGHSLTVIQRVMGHESITTTSDTYGHMFRADRDALANVLSFGVAAVDTGPLAIEAQPIINAEVLDAS